MTLEEAKALKSGDLLTFYDYTEVWRVVTVEKRGIVKEIARGGGHKGFSDFEFIAKAGRLLQDKPAQQDQIRRAQEVISRESKIFRNVKVERVEFPKPLEALVYVEGAPEPLQCWGNFAVYIERGRPAYDRFEMRWPDDGRPGWKPEDINKGEYMRNHTILPRQAKILLSIDATEWRGLVAFLSPACPPGLETLLAKLESMLKGPLGVIAGTFQEFQTYQESLSELDRLRAFYVIDAPSLRGLPVDTELVWHGSGRERPDVEFLENEIEALNLKVQSVEPS